MSATAKGVDTQAVCYKEDTYGQPPGTPKGTRVYYETIGIQSTRALIDSPTVIGGRQRSQPEQDTIDVTGPISCVASAHDQGFFLEQVFYSVNTTGPGPFIHEFTLGPTQPTGFRIEIDNGPSFTGDRYYSFAGCQCVAAEVTIEPAGWARIQYEILGQDFSKAADPLDASPFDPGHVSFSNARATITEGGSVLGIARRLNFRIDNNNETDIRSIGPGGLRIDAPNGFVTVSGTMDVLYQDEALLDKALNATPSDLLVEFKRGDGSGSANNESLTFDIEALIFERSTPAIDTTGSRTLTLNFRGYKDGAAESIRATMKNSNATIEKP